MHTDREPVDLDTLSEMGYEKRDVNYGSLTRWIVAFFGLGFAFFLAAYGFYRWLAPEQNKFGRSGEELKTRRVPPAPNPLLQNNIETKVDIQKMRQDEIRLLTSYGWVDQGSGVIRMPIERAKELLAQRGAEAAAGPSSVAPIRRDDVSPRGPTGGAPADKVPGGANAGDTAPRTRIPSGKATQDVERNGGVTNAPTGSDAAPSNASAGDLSAPGQPGVRPGGQGGNQGGQTGPTNGARE